MTRRTLGLLLGGLALAAALAGVLTAHWQRQADADRRPDFTLNDLSGAPRSVSEWDGKVLVVNFWATWCPPCREEIPHFVALQNELGGQGVQFLGVAIDEPAEVRAFVREHGVNYPTLVGAEDAMAVSQRFGNDLGALPYTVIVDRTGRVAFTHRGALPKADIERALRAQL